MSMRRTNCSNASRRSSTTRKRSDILHFDEFGFAISKRKEQKVNHRCHHYSYPQLSLVRVKELCELLSYWNGASFICRSQIERFIKLGIPPSLRGRVWKCLLAIDSLKEKSDFNYQKCLSEVRGPLVDLGISEYGILSAIATLSETQNDPGWNHQQSSSCHETSYSVDDITVFRQIALDLQRSFPTHRSLMGESPEAIEGQAKLFRILIAYSKYNPHVGYSQGMSYLAAVLLMQLEEEEAFWALTALLEKPKYLGELFDFNQTRVQHQVKMFDQFLKHRKPKFSQHMESVGVLSVHFLMPWFLTLFTSLPCWDSVLAVWDLIILDGLSAVFRTALTIIELLEPKLMDLNDEGVLLPLLLRVPVDVAQYTNLVPSLWNTEVHDWELKCMSSLVMDNSHHGLEEENCRNQNIDDPTQAGGGEKENVSTPHREESTTEKDTGTGVQRVLCHVMRLAQQYLLDPIGRQGLVGKSSKTQAKPRQCSSAPGRVFRARGSASLTHAQITSRRRSQQRGRVQQPPVQNNGGDLIRTSVTVSDTAGNGKADRTLKRTGTGPIGKVAHFHGKRGPFQPARVKAQHVLRNDKNLPNQLPNSSSNLACPSTTSQSAQILSSSPPSSDTTQSMDQLKQQDTPRTALLK